MHAELRSQLKEKLRQNGVDLYIACTPSNVHYASGFQSAFIDLSWQMTGTDLVVVPTAEELEPAIIVSEYCAPTARDQSDISDIRTYSMWTEGRDYAVVADTTSNGEFRIERPQQYHHSEIFGLVRDVMNERGLSGARIGSDLSLMKHSTFEWLRRTFPNNELIECEHVLYDARRIKHPGEIDRLRRAAKLFDAGVEHVVSHIREGQTLEQMKYNFDAGVSATLAADPGLGNCQGIFFFPHLGTNIGSPAKRGDIVKLDCGAKIDGYWSDGCRHFCLGEANADQMDIHEALMAGFVAAEQMLKPGSKMKDIYETAITAVRESGLPNYSRGHFGHSIGMDDQTEEPPFIGPNEAILEPNMVVCLELPFYPADVGGFNIEDMFLISETGFEVLTLLPRDLVELPI